MRFDYINLLAFGHFTDYELSFDPSKNFHLLYGPNEAGKSTTLRSIIHFLYGFPQKTADSFLHSNAKLRIEGQLRDSKGDALQFIRRKGRKDTVLQLDGSPLNEKVVNNFLHGMSETHFLNMFALNHETLREGGESLLQSGGSVGESVFSAASGINVMRKIFDHFDKESSTIYKKNGQNPQLNKLLIKEKENNKLLSEFQLKIQNWKELERKYNDEKQEVERLIQHVKELRNEQEKLHRVKIMLPKLAKKRDLFEKLTEIGVVPNLPDDLNQVRTSAENRLLAANHDQEKIEKELLEVKEKIKSITIPEKILEQERSILDLYREVQSIQNDEMRIPELEGVKKQLEVQVISIMKDIDSAHAHINKIDLYRLSAEKKETIRELCKKILLLNQTDENLEREKNQLEKELSEKVEVLSTIPVLQNIDGLEEVIDQVKRSGKIDEAINALKEANQQKLWEINDKLRQLSPWTGTYQELIELPVPGLTQTVKKFEREHVEILQQLQKIADQMKQQKQAIEGFEESIRILESLAEIPSMDKLSTIRASRDEGWKLIRTKLQTGNWSDKLQKYTNGQNIEFVYENYVQNADNIADTMRLEAEKVGEKNKLISDIEKSKKKLIELENEELCVTNQLVQWEKEWIELWKSAGINPLTPEEMTEWLQKYEQIKSLVHEYENDSATMLQYEAVVDQHKKDLMEILQPLIKVTDNQTVEEMLRIAEKQLKQIREDINKRTGLEASIRETNEKLKNTVNEKSLVETKIKKWKNEWIQSVENTNISVSTSPSIAEKLLHQYETCTQAYDDFKKVEKELESMVEKISLFKERVVNVLRTVNISMEEQSVDTVVNWLYGLLQNAQEDKVTYTNLMNQRNGLKGKLNEINEKINAAQTILNDLFKKANCQTIEELESIEKTFLLKKEYERMLRAVDEEMIELGNGKTLNELIAEAEQYDSDSIDGELEEIIRKFDQAESERSVAEQAYGVTKKEYEEKIKGNSTASVQAEQEKESIHANIASLTEKYIQCKLASILLQKGIEHYRSQNQNPILQRASEIFKRLTLHSFTGLTVDYDEKDQPILMGVRDNNERVSIIGMSDGTTDQLYLSLRIASIEKYVSENEPIPFILDDILVHFDDIRSKETLKILLELSKQTQIIFFTHHARLMEIMKEITSEDEYQLININHKAPVTL